MSKQSSIIQIALEKSNKKILQVLLKREEIFNYLQKHVDLAIAKNKKITATCSSGKRKSTLAFPCKNKEKFKALFTSGSSMSCYLYYIIIGLLIEKNALKPYKHSILYTEDDSTINIEVSLKSSRIDIYVEQELKDMYLDMTNKLDVDIASHLYFFVKNALRSGNPIGNVKVTTGKRTSVIVLKLTEKEKKDFKALFLKGSSISTFFREAMIEELIKNGYKDAEKFQVFTPAGYVQKIGRHKG